MNWPSAPCASGYAPASVLAHTPALIGDTAANDSTRFPDFVFTINDATRERSSCGASVTSRTRPLAAPDGSYTVAPNNSVRASVVIPLEHTQLTRESKPISAEMSRKYSDQTKSKGARRNTCEIMGEPCPFALL